MLIFNKKENLSNNLDFMGIGAGGLLIIFIFYKLGFIHYMR